MTSELNDSMLIIISFSVHDVCVFSFNAFANAFAMIMSRPRLTHTLCRRRWLQSSLCASSNESLNLISSHSAKSWRYCSHIFSSLKLLLVHDLILFLIYSSSLSVWDWYLRVSRVLLIDSVSSPDSDSSSNPDSNSCSSSFRSENNAEEFMSARMR